MTPEQTARNRTIARALGWIEGANGYWRPDASGLVRILPDFVEIIGRALNEEVSHDH